jgi:uncharacterized iron-regulated protein
MTHKGKILDSEDFFNVLMDYNAIFIGEEHEASISHKAELTILTELAERDSSLVLALEMFERDIQDTLDAYLKGGIPEEEFLEIARPWPNYHEDYRPLIELAKRKGIPVIAANLPRRAAAAVAMANKISPEVLGSDSAYIPDTYYLQTLPGHHGNNAQSGSDENEKNRGPFQGPGPQGCRHGWLAECLPGPPHPLLLRPLSFRLPSWNPLSTSKESPSS